MNSRDKVGPFDPGLRRKPLAIRLLRGAKSLVPGEYLRTWIFLNLIARPRKALRTMIFGFYRMEVIYEVLGQARSRYRGRFSILEFGTADGYSFTKMLYATRFTSMEDRVTVHAFDTFEGMPAPRGEADQDPVLGDGWVEGEFRGHFEELREYCQRKYRNFELHRGLFSDTLTPEFLESLRKEPPILIWMDCDYYSSARCAFERIEPYLPNGCVIYFDDIDDHMGTRFTGEARLVDEVNRGELGAIELVPDLGLSLDRRRCFRFFRRPPSEVSYEAVSSRHSSDYVRKRGDDSPFP